MFTWQMGVFSIEQVSLHKDVKKSWYGASCWHYRLCERQSHTEMGHCAPEGSVVPQEGIDIGFMEAGRWRAVGV